MRIGHGIDMHAFVVDEADTTPLVLGGVTIEAHRGLSGHSDADVLCHAIADALLGAGALGDLGSNFPATQEWAGASGVRILERVAELLADAGLAIANVDSTIIAERPRLAAHAERMSAAIAGALGVTTDAVSVKVTSTDALGALGRGEGIAAMAVALLDVRVAG
ncbi:MAG TPA: 2-C-methyl-D-erythritol 2,4-cyclodiphosphate synthase [Actinomycetota bacterium]|nr:2-C-methyl-D-erythritol 2,4-cyclodiphosphate synthase [Actinomycetota bacterium]